MPWLMMVLSSATTGRPDASASRTSSVTVSNSGSLLGRVLLGVVGDDVGQVGSDGVGALDGRGGGAVTEARGRDGVGAPQPGRDPGGEHRVTRAGHVHDGGRDGGQVDRLLAAAAHPRPVRTVPQPDVLDAPLVQVGDGSAPVGRGATGEG